MQAPRPAPGVGNKGSRCTSNKTHYSPTDPDARISVKPGKARKLNYSSQLSVDTANHVITDIKAYHADGKDNQYLKGIVARLQRRLWKLGFQLENVLADTGYSSGGNPARNAMPTWRARETTAIYHRMEPTRVAPKGLSTYQSRNNITVRMVPLYLSRRCF